VLLMYITKVSGHRAATLAIERALNQLDPTAEIMSINGFGYTYPTIEKVVNKAYMGIIKRTPQIWDYLYDNPKIVKKTESLKNYIHKTSHDKLRRLFETFQPDAVVCTQAFPCGMVADFKRVYPSKYVLIGVLTDYAPHGFWINEGVDYYIVPCEETKRHFVGKGVSPEAIKVFGIPIQTKFGKRLNRHLLSQKLGLQEDLPTVLIMGGGQGLGPIKGAVRSLLKVKKEFQIIVVAGTNKRLIKWLKNTTQKKDKKILIFEYVENIDELMGLATLLITKPGGMTTAEALAKGLPMVIIKPLPGQEVRNTEFLLQEDIAIRVDKTKEIGNQVELLLKNSQRLSLMRNAALRNSHPQAALDIARLILGQPHN